MTAPADDFRVRSDEVHLKEYIEKILGEMDRRYMDRFKLSDEAVAKAERTMNERLNSMNEFREALKEQAGRMATRVELEKVDTNVQELQRAKAKMDGGLLVVSGLISAVVSAVVWALSHLVK